MPPSPFRRHRGPLLVPEAGRHFEENGKSLLLLLVCIVLYATGRKIHGSLSKPDLPEDIFEYLFYCGQPSTIDRPTLPRGAVSKRRSRETDGATRYAHIGMVETYLPRPAKAYPPIARSIVWASWLSVSSTTTCRRSQQRNRPPTRFNSTETRMNRSTVVDLPLINN